MDKSGVGASTIEPKMLTIPQVATILQMSASKAYLMAARGELPIVRFGRLVRVEPERLAQWIKERSA